MLFSFHTSGLDSPIQMGILSNCVFFRGPLIIWWEGRYSSSHLTCPMLSLVMENTFPPETGIAIPCSFGTTIFRAHSWWHAAMVKKTSPNLQSAVDSIGRYVQESKYFLVLCPCVAHAETGQLLCRESWKSRGWCRFERVCREFLGQDANIAVIETWLCLVCQ